jgi:hypothetical protein
MAKHSLVVADVNRSIVIQKLFHLSKWEMDDTLPAMYSQLTETQNLLKGKATL